MCGIAGIYDLSGHGRADPALVRRMSRCIVHRGPDGDGFYDAPDVVLGMRRLSIIDVVGSDQPLYNEDRSLVLVFNGEIYNYRELQAELTRAGHHLRTAGDGETILHLYEQHGLDLFAHLRGMYAFALWDAPRKRLILAVDHIGMKPLYLHERGGKLAFASEVKALLADEHFRPALNLDVLDTYLSFGYMIGEETLFDGVRRLPAGHALIAEGGATRLHPFWSFGAGYAGAPPPERLTLSDEGWIARARGLISDSVRLHLRSDVPLGLFLSGGIDSAAVLALMARENQDNGGVDARIKTFTVGYQAAAGALPDNELLHARRIAEHFRTDHHERVISAEDWWRGFERAIAHHDEPIANESAVSLLLLAEDTARHVKVVLTGLGGDELFGGYAHHRSIPWLLDAQRRWGHWLTPLAGAAGALEPFYPAFKRYRYIGALPTYLPRLRLALLPRDEALLRSQSFDGLTFSDTLRRRLYGDALRAASGRARHKERAFAQIIERSLRPDPFHTAQALVVNSWLTGNALLHVDKVTMASSLEARVPFFDPALLALAAELPPRLQLTRNKHVLREAMRPYVPEFALERPKQPFSTPIRSWFEHELADRIQAALRDPAAQIRAILNSPALDKLLDGHFSGRAPQVEVVFRLLTLELWAQHYLTAAPAYAAVRETL